MFRFWGLLLVFILGVWTAPNISAHELRPAYLSITEISEHQYNILWKTPALGEKQLALKVRLPQDCQISNGRRSVEKSKFAIETWQLDCPVSLRGQVLKIGGLEKTLTDVLVRSAWLNGDELTARLTPDNTQLHFAEQGQESGVIRTYFMLGFKHILGGLDHLIFVLAVMLLITRGKKLLWAITAFTLGHSITLAFATLGLVTVNASLVELLIAMSIVLMAYEAARRWSGHSGITLENPWLVTFSFGLLHGFGFAGALLDIGLPQGDILGALFFFNIGVEAGQLLFVAVLLMVASLPILKWFHQTKRPMMLMSYAIGAVSVYWIIQRAGPVFLIG